MLNSNFDLRKFLTESKASTEQIQEATLTEATVMEYIREKVSGVNNEVRTCMREYLETCSEIDMEHEDAHAQLMNALEDFYNKLRAHFEEDAIEDEMEPTNDIPPIPTPTLAEEEEEDDLFGAGEEDEEKEEDQIEEWGDGSGIYYNGGEKKDKKEKEDKEDDVDEGFLDRLKKKPAQSEPTPAKVLSADEIQAMIDKEAKTGDILNAATVLGTIDLRNATPEQIKMFISIARDSDHGHDTITGDNYIDYLESLPNYKGVAEVNVNVSIPGQDDFEAEEGKDYSEEEADEYIKNAKDSGATPMGTTFKKVNKKASIPGQDEPDEDVVNELDSKEALWPLPEEWYSKYYTVDFYADGPRFFSNETGEEVSYKDISAHYEKEAEEEIDEATFGEAGNKGNWKGSADANPVTFMNRGYHIVISDPTNGLADEDPKKVENILFVIDKEFKRLAKIKKMNFKNLEANGAFDSLKYYEKTDKIVGVLPTWLFTKKPLTTKNSIKSTKFYPSLKDRYPTLQLTLKKPLRIPEKVVSEEVVSEGLDTKTVDLLMGLAKTAVNMGTIPAALLILNKYKDHPKIKKVVTAFEKHLDK